MKIILSRKGFDSQYGGIPNPILPDGSLLSLPIPSKNSTVMFRDITYRGKNLYEMIKELSPNSKIKENHSCHLDPDLCNYMNYECWKPGFGQQGNDESHLNNQNVGTNDIFLFFGTFRKTIIENNTLKFEKGSPKVHIIFAYLQIGNKYNDISKIPKEYQYHPHVKDIDNKRNALYTASDQLSLDKQLPGYGVFDFNELLTLTKDGFSKSRWNLPEYFKEFKISRHTTESFKNDYFQSISKGQEIVINGDHRLIDWTYNIITSGLGIL